MIRMRGNLPGFQGELALSSSARGYRGFAGAGAPAYRPRVVSQLTAPPGAPGRSGQRLATGRLGFACGGFACTCSGDEDCNDMFSTGACGDIAQCVDDMCWCLRF